MIDLYYWPTPNGWKITILLEELGLEYKVIPVDILKGEQYAPEFVALNPNSKIPVLVDSDVTLFESGAIMLYLAEKTGRFFAETTRGKYDVLQWLMFQMGGVGPFFGQANHFTRYAGEEVPYAIERYTNEAARLLRVMDKQLDGRDWIAGGGYSIADMAFLRPIPMSRIGSPALWRARRCSAASRCWRRRARRRRNLMKKRGR